MGVAIQGGKDINDKYGYGDPNSKYYDPLHVEKNPEEYKTVRYDKMVTLAIAAIKEQQLQIEELTKDLPEEFKKEIVDQKRINFILNKIKGKSKKLKIDPKITNRIWKNILGLLTWDLLFKESLDKLFSPKKLCNVA